MRSLLALYFVVVAAGNVALAVSGTRWLHELRAGWIEILPGPALPEITERAMRLVPWSYVLAALGIAGVAGCFVRRIEERWLHHYVVWILIGDTGLLAFSVFALTAPAWIMGHY